jgi:universal stress protein E
MHIFKNILVGIDLARCKPLDISGLNPVALEPIHWAIQLAKANSAQLLFFAASNIGEEALSPLAEEDRSQVRETIFQGGNKVLQDLVNQAKTRGVEAQSKLVLGKGWLEIIRQVLRGKHDLVVVGTRDLTGFRRMLFGNTAMKLLRRCPCPILVTKTLTFASGVLGASLHRSPDTGVSPLNILVATDLKPSSQDALRLGIALAQQMNAHLHILHVVEYKLDEVCNIGLPDAKQDDYRRKVRAQAQEVLRVQLEKTNYKSLGANIEVHLSGDVGLPDVAIQHFIQTYHIHLLVMGTIGRGGIRGIMIGNTAERLLPEVHCSVLAVKPPDFVCPVEGEEAGASSE